ncbi:methyl-accepting chemotaxis protein [Ideonella sp. DXS22W]|uniref:Methyl-accepting chemotaxis protein n=1 Tax=Pseudaquabacterium inlustre TaxID=2984192 RepID=A0ABU9CIT4_9BURK
MRANLPVTQREHPFPAGELLVSTTDLQGRITHCNRAFVEVSGYSYDELLGQPHNMIRHPDMPPEAFKDMWATIGRGRPWTGVVKNRCKNGDHYWVEANVTPILANGKPEAYMSVRRQPTREQVREAEALYARLAAERANGRATFKLHAGRVRLLGWRDLPGRLHRLSLTGRLALGMGLALLATLGAGALAGGWAATAAAVLGGGAVTAWFHASVQRRLDEAERFANDLSACNLRSRLDLVHPHPLSALARALAQIQINLQAVIGDARQEVDGTATSTGEISRGAADLSQRTRAQAEALQRTAASMEQMAAAVRQTASTAGDVARQSEHTAQAAAAGGQAMAGVEGAIRTIEQHSKSVAEIVQVIEGIAFRTNLLALNAAVEAARAGEQGRGFAVVAGEVRALAQRSADAAREIRTLIHRSVEEVADGTRRVVDANQTIGRTVDEVNRVGGLIHDITRAASEQSLGIGEVNAAVSELDHMTQANAALVQQTVAAVEMLHKRSATLERTVHVFRT